MHRPWITDSVTEIDPRPTIQERRDEAGIEGVGQTGQQHRGQPVLARGGGSIPHQMELLLLPVAEIVGPDKHRAGRRISDPSRERVLPSLSWDQLLLIQPGSQPLLAEKSRDFANDWLVLTVVREEDVKKATHGLVPWWSRVATRISSNHRPRWRSDGGAI